ncbi:MAG: thioredoxin family protein [Desulfobacula sp.]|nr:thioredoxin family protein [Desulfobacula sp.]
MTLFDPESQAKIKTFTQTRPIKTRIQRLSTGHAEDPPFALMAGALSTLIPDLVIEEEKTDTGLPGFRLKDNITYSALPLDKELGPFLEALAGLSGQGSPLSGEIVKTLDGIDIPVRLTLYIALQCPFCPTVVRTVSALALYCPRIRLHIIDGSLFPETAAKDGVMSAPCLILDDGFRWTGQVTAHEILNMALHRDPAQLSAKSLQTILEQGDASWITRQMVEKNQIFDGFIALLLHDTWSVRLGAMVIVEDLCESAPELAARICPILMNRFDEKDIPVKGDILYVLGLAGDEAAGEWIRARLASLDHRDLADAAQDALETLASKKA